MDHSNAYSSSNTPYPVIRERKLPLRAEMLSWLVEQALKCNKTREHKVSAFLWHMNPSRTPSSPWKWRMWNSHGRWNPSDPSWQGCGSCIYSLQQSSKVTFLPAFRGAAEKLVCMVWSLGGWNRGRINCII